MPKPERVIRVEAVVLRHADWGEADRLLTLFTREQGKLRAIAKGARKMRSRKAGHLEPFTHVSLMLAAGRDMWIVTQAEALNVFQPLRDDLMRMGLAAYVIELLDRFTYEEGALPGLFKLLVDTLGRLTGEIDPFYTLRYYELRLLELVGYRPELFYCVQCQSEIKPQEQFFSVQLGGAVCPNCGPSVPGSRAISMPALKYLRHFQRSQFEDCLRAQIEDRYRNEMESILHLYVTGFLERGLNTPSFIRSVQNQA
jgi:DNA repair protein RecO (recombination protein O)